MKRASKHLSNYILAGILILLAGNAIAQLPDGYKGFPYKDSVYTGTKLNPRGAQMLPGRLELAWYDFGGEGIAWHDNTPENEGALSNRLQGKLRPGISDYVAFFRENEGVDINYTKDIDDFGHLNKVDPKVNQLYICDQESGEWTNYTVHVNQKGKYIIYTVYSSIKNGYAELWVNNQLISKLTFPEITGDLHKWTQSEIGAITFPETGDYLLTIRFGEGVNFGYLDFLYNDARQK